MDWFCMIYVVYVQGCSDYPPKSGLSWIIWVESIRNSYFLSVKEGKEESPSSILITRNPN